MRFRRGIPVIHHCTARFPRRFAPRNDKPVCPAPMNLCCKTYSLQGAQGTPLQTQSVHTVLSTPCTNCKCSAGSGMPFPATRHEGLTSNENIRLTAAHLMLYTDTGGPQPVRLQENPPSQKFRREEKCERLTIKSQARNAEERQKFRRFKRGIAKLTSFWTPT